MIKKLEKKFRILATVSTTALMMTLIIIMNLINLSSVIKESDGVLEVLSQPDAPFLFEQNPPDEPLKKFDDFIPRDMSPEVPYESRYFTATVSLDGEIEDTNITKIISVDEENAKEYIEKAVNRKSDKGFIGQFRYYKTTDNKNCRIMFLDCGRKLDAFFTFMWISIAIGVLGCIIVFVVFYFAGSRIIKPISESYEKQKRFITDAGHEIKTPLTIISANTDLLELDTGENESIEEIRNQTKRLSALTKDLVFLSKMEESTDEVPKIDFPVSELVAETAQQFKAIATSQNKNYEINIQPDISINGSPDDTRKLVSILLDNAMKYSPENGEISVSLSVQKKNLVLSVKNTSTEPLDKESISKVFDRFYRMDKSRNSQTGGHGIGLSIAKAITESNKGKISASTQNGNDFSVTVNIPM